MNELIIENKNGDRKLITVRKFFLGFDDAKKWVEKKYRGYKLVGVQDGLFGDIREPR